MLTLVNSSTQLVLQLCEPGHRCTMEVRCPYQGGFSCGKEPDCGERRHFSKASSSRRARTTTRSSARCRSVHGLANEAAELKGKVDKIANEACSAPEEAAGDLAV